MPLIAPHGGTLVNRLATGKAREHLLERAATLPKFTLDATQASDFELLANGGFSPLTGFQTKKDYDAVLERGRLAGGLAWTIPVVLRTDLPVKDGAELALTDGSGLVLGTIKVESAWAADLEAEARAVYGTKDAAHPGVAWIRQAGATLFGGTIEAANLPPHGDFGDYRLTPAQARAEFERRGWRTVVGFQTRNPIHRAHEYLTKVALETVDGLLLHPLVGETKKDDIPADVRMRCYEALLADYYPPARTALAVNPAAMRYAGPKEAIFHAIVRQNFGCSHFIVGRDHAGVGTYYGTYDAQKIWETYSPAELAIQPLKFENSFWCKKCGGMASAKTCAHAETERVSLSGTKVRELLGRGEIPPVEFTRPEVAKILIEHYGATT
ncbi:MAG: sulfate adenylyltransferase [Planctomycetes bacterium]|nr:sulfate adenylyltransferase [Planctomycetota bacterium]